MNEEYVYDFCLDWQMNVVSKKELIKQFAKDSVDYYSFCSVAKKRNWFTTSMHILLYSNEF